MAPLCPANWKQLEQRCSWDPSWLSSFVLLRELGSRSGAEQSTHSSWPLALCWDKPAPGSFGRADSGRDVEQSSSCFATALAASTTISAPALSHGRLQQERGWGIFPALEGLGWAELVQFRWGQAGLGCTGCRSNYIRVIWINCLSSFKMEIM